MPWQRRRNAPLAEARAERDIRISLDNRAEKNRQLRRPVTVVAIEEDHYVGRICPGQPRQARLSISATRFLKDARPHSRGDFGCSVIRVAVNNDYLCDQIGRKICKNAGDRLRFIVGGNDDRHAHVNLAGITTTTRTTAVVPATRQRPISGLRVRPRAQGMQAPKPAVPISTMCPTPKSKGCRETEKPRMRPGG